MATNLVGLAVDAAAVRAIARAAGLDQHIGQIHSTRYTTRVWVRPDAPEGAASALADALYPHWADGAWRVRRYGDQGVGIERYQAAQIPPAPPRPTDCPLSPYGWAVLVDATRRSDGHLYATHRDPVAAELVGLDHAALRDPKAPGLGYMITDAGRALVETAT